MCESVAMATKIFISCAEKDADYLAELEAHLADLKRDGVLRTWHIGTVGPGVQWEPELRSQLDSADIIIVLLSADFFASDRCCEIELQRASQRAAFSQVRIIPILLRACVWNNTPFAHVRVLPSGDRPLSTWIHRDDAWQEVVRAILDAVRCMDERAALFAYRRQSFLPEITNNSCLSFIRVCLDRTDERWAETSRVSPMDPAPFGIEDGQHILLQDLFHDPVGGVSLNLDVTVINRSALPLVLTKIGIEIVAVAQITEGHGEGVPSKVHKTDAYVLHLPDVREILSAKFPGEHYLASKGPVMLDLLVSAYVDDPVNIPANTPYRYGLSLSRYAEKMPNHALIRAWALTSEGQSTSTCINVCTY